MSNKEKNTESTLDRRKLMVAGGVGLAGSLMAGWGALPAAAKMSQSAAGIIPDADPKTFAEVLAKINASDAFLEALAKQPDETPIINLNFICCRPRGNMTQYEAYGAVAGKEINGVGGSIAGYAVGITDADADYQLSDKWDVVDLPVYPRRGSYLQC